MTILVFVRLLSCDFTTWDDNLTVLTNPDLNPPTWTSFVHPWLKPHMDLYVPVTYMAWTLVAFVSSMLGPGQSGASGLLNPAVFHAANILVHLLSVLVVFRLIRDLGITTWPAAIGAAVFAVHPVQVEPVAWISGLKDVLCGLLSLLSIWQFLLFASGAGHRRRHYVLGLIAFMLALLAKPSAVVVPALALIVVVMGKKQSIRSAGIALLPWLVAAVACVAWTTIVQPAHLRAPHMRLYLRPLIATDALAFYLYKLLWPITLTIDYGRTPERAAGAGWIYYTWLAPLGVALLLIWKRRRWPLVGAGALFAVIAIAPVLGLIRFDFQLISTVADHYLYLAMAGVALSVSAFVQRASERWNRKAVAIAACAVIGLLGLRSILEEGHWQNTESLFHHVLQVNEQSWAAHQSLAVLYNDSGDPARALPHALRSVELAPNDAKNFGTLGSVLAKLGRIPEAAAAYRKSAELAPDSSEAHAALAGALAQLEQFPAAEAEARRAIELDPNEPRGHVNLGTLLASCGRTEEGIAELEKAIQLAPRQFPEARANLGFLLLQKGQTDQAMEQFRAALSINPNFMPARVGLQQAEQSRGLR